MDLSIFGSNAEVFGETPVVLKLKYKDIIGKTYEESQEIDVRKGYQPMKMGNEMEEEALNVLKGMLKQLSVISDVLKRGADKRLIKQPE